MQVEAAFFSLPLGLSSQATKLSQRSVDWVLSRQMVSGLLVPVALGHLTFSLCLQRVVLVQFALGSIWRYSISIERVLFLASVVSVAGKSNVPIISE